ncbi:hypothetical protein TRIUR3_17061 [Triticum urartu]|uniref:Uncharacterized protein n=1 Tax=Triticum urartu TaxID=4572 RepID=M7Z3S4_TRIUA|nr:hypothetical protein TRIUR3_17061 [Triticum urartu]
MRHRFTAFSVNAVVLLVVGAAMLGLNGGGDRPAGVSRAQYYAGFAMTLGSAAMYGLVLPLMELSQAQHAARAGAPVTYTLVLEIQMVIGITATAFSAVGMLVNREFHLIGQRFEPGYGHDGACDVVLVLALAVDFICRLVDLLEGVALAPPVVAADVASGAIGFEQRLLLGHIHVWRDGRADAELLLCAPVLVKGAKAVLLVGLR